MTHCTSGRASNATLITALTVWLTLVPAAPLCAQTKPPVARPGPVVDTLHGSPIPDPFRSLETGTGADAKAWVAAQDKYARDFAAGSPRHGRIREAIRAIAEATVFSAPIERGALEFYTTFMASGPGSTFDLFVRKSGGRSGGTLLPGFDSHRQRTGEKALLFQPSPDGRHVVVGFSKSGTSWLTLRVFRVADGAILPDSVPAYYRPLASVNWSLKSDGFYYDLFEPDTTAGARGVNSGSVRFHRLGSAASDPIVFAPRPERNLVIGHSRSPAGRILVIVTTNTDTRANLVWFLDGEVPGPPRAASPPGEGTYSFAGELDGRLFFLSRAGAPRGKIMAFDPTSSRWSTIIPEGPDPISTWPGLGAAVLGRQVLVAYVKDSRLDLKLFRPDGSAPRPIALPKVGSIWSGFVGTPESGVAFYQLQGLADPGTIYRLDLTTGASTSYLKPGLAYDPDRLVTERRLYPSKDGTLVPIHIVRRAAQSLDGSAPLILYGYGFLGWIGAPWFQPAMAHWVSQGGVWALAGVRGGGEFGEAWQNAGARRNKQTGIDDFNAATEWLIAKRYTSADRMVANASSAGGPLVAAATLQRPELYRAAIFDYSVFDMLRYDQYSHARSWQSDYGTASNLEDFEILRRYSPYHTVRTGQCYPAVLATPGELDQTAPPFHSYKFVAALQHAGSSCGRPALVRVSWGAGHAAGGSPAAAVETWADELGFLDRVLGKAKGRP